MIPKEKLMHDPSSVFDRPADVVRNRELSHGEKIEILRQWKQEVMLRMIAEDEAEMPEDAKNPDRLQQVSEALVVLEDE